ncbi:transcriptional regulator NrdR [candidate division KSB1 bacterium]
MKCPYCHSGDDKVIDSRSVRDGEAIRRRRECIGCGGRYTTYEYIESITYKVVKRDGTREDFDRKKLEEGIIRACSKRPIPFEKIQEAVDSIIERLQSDHYKEIPADLIGELVMNALKELDDVAYVRFASVYRKFEAKEDFVRTIKGIEKEKSKKR